jgi:glycerol-3-phosphate dehydrogenase
MAPWREVSVVGTSHDPYTGAPDDLAVTAPDVDKFLADVVRAFPRAGLTRTDVRLVHRGLLPAAPGVGAHERLLKQSLVVDHRRHGLANLLSIVGVRYTTARATAAGAVDLALAALGRAAVPCRTALTPLVGGDLPDFPAFERDAASALPSRLDRAALPRLTRCYGSELPALTRLVDAAPALAAPLSPACGVTGAEIAYAARHEMAVHLTDAVIRRTDAGSAGHPGADAVRAAAAVMGAEHGWSAERAAEEIAAVDRFYHIAD